MIGSVLGVVERNLGNRMASPHSQLIRVTRATFHTINAVEIVGAVLNFSPRTGCHIRIEVNGELCYLVSCSIVVQIYLDVCGIFRINNTSLRIPECNEAAVAILMLGRWRQQVIEIEALVVGIISSAFTSSLFRSTFGL